MPPRTRSVRAPKALKENVDIPTATKAKQIGKATKSVRKPLADKTNSASDENISPEPVKKVIKKSTKPPLKVVPVTSEEDRPRRNRRLPPRYVENEVLNNLSNNKENATTPNKSLPKTPVKGTPNAKSPFKTPTSVSDSSLIDNRPKRLSHLPSKFDENSVSPNRFVPTHCQTSTPLVTKTQDKPRVQNRAKAQDNSKALGKPLKAQEKLKPLDKLKVQEKTKTPEKPKAQEKPKVQNKPYDVKKLLHGEQKLTTNLESRKILKANTSFRVLEDKKTKNNMNQDIYEFTFDPTEEPRPLKKKRKKVTVKKPSKPKTRVYNNNYEKNIARALADLKNVVTKQKPEDAKVAKTTKPPVTSNKITTSEPNPSSIVISTVAEIHPDPAQNASIRSNVSIKNHVSYRVEDIAADFDASMDHHEINYSPVNSPHQVEIEPEIRPSTPQTARPDDPLNLRNDLSFFDDQPVANSSMNVSKNPTATPWRAEFENLPIKWQANTYVKPDMTPALECSFVNNFDDSKKRHVYTNIMPPTNDALPEIDGNEAPRLKQTSIISFIKEVIERSSGKKKKGATTTPTKANSLFDMSHVTPMKERSNIENTIENEGSKGQKRKNDYDNNPTPAKQPRKDNDTLFGFDDSENQENVSPVKVACNNRLRSLRSRSGAVLKELNKQAGPMRAQLPAAMKAKLAPSSEAVEKIYDQMKSAADAPMLPDKEGDAGITNVEENADNMEDDSQSVHLFEDIELVHHLKPTRKSYGKAKKVTFQNSDSAFDDEAVRNQSSDDDADHLEDLSFHLPEVKTKKVTKKKKTKKQVLSKKEKAEVDAWAACFNSMCEDIEEFDLVVE